MRPSEFTVLLVEDDPSDVLFFRRALSTARLTLRLHVATDGEEAVAYLAGEGIYSDRKAHPLPSLMLLDLKLPRKSGLEVLEWLKERPAIKQFPVAVFTSSSEPQDVKRAYELGADSYLVKRVGFECLLRIMEGIRAFESAREAGGRPAPFRVGFEGEPRRSLRSPVLIVEDDQELREALRDTLQEAGFDVVEAANGEEALRSLGRSPSISVILLDVILPVMDGWQFRMAQKRDPALEKIPVVAISGYPSIVDQRPIDSDAFLPKPVTAEILVAAVRHCSGAESDTGPQP